MSPTRGRSLLLCLFPAALMAWGIATLTLRVAGWFAGPPLWVAIPPLVISLVLLVLGWQVRQLRERRLSAMPPSSAPAVAAAAKAASVVGAVVAGYYLGFLPLILTESGSPMLSALILRSAVCAAGYLLLLGAGMVVERWCHIELDDDAGPTMGRSAASAI